MLRRMLVAGYSNGNPTLLRLHVEIDEDLAYERHIEVVQVAAKHFGVAGPHVVFDVEKDCKSLFFVDLDSERAWSDAPIFLDGMA